MEYQVHSIVRNPLTRTLRAAAPLHHRRVQYVLDTQQRLIPGRPVGITREGIARNLDHLISLEQQGIAEVRTADGRKFDLRTLAVIPAHAQPPLPNIRLDSLANDVPEGENYFPAPGQPGTEKMLERLGPKPVVTEPETTVAAPEPTPTVVYEEPPPAPENNPDFAASGEVVPEEVEEEPEFEHIETPTAPAVPQGRGKKNRKLEHGTRGNPRRHSRHSRVRAGGS